MIGSFTFRIALPIATMMGPGSDVTTLEAAEPPVTSHNCGTGSSINLLEDDPQFQLSEDADSSSSVADFVCAKGLQQLMDTARVLIDEHFTIAGPIGLSLETDPEIDDQWISVRIPAGGNIRQSYWDFKQDWLREAPRELSGMIRINPVVG